MIIKGVAMNIPPHRPFPEPSSLEGVSLDSLSPKKTGKDEEHTKVTTHKVSQPIFQNIMLTLEHKFLNGRGR